ncbi:MAG: hypothetical protein Q9182_004344 [Xanthomendoza sp. 2 TL-2023]
MSEETKPVNCTALTTRETELAVLALQSLKNGFIQIDEEKFARMGGYSNARSANVCFANLKKKLNTATVEAHYVAAGTGGGPLKVTTPKKGSRGSTKPKTPTKRKADDNSDATPTKRSKGGDQAKEEDQDEELSAASETLKDEEV